MGTHVPYGSHSVTCHPAEVTFPPLPQPIKAGTRFSDPGGMQDWVDLVGLVTYQGGIPARRRLPIPVLNVEQLRSCDERRYHSAKHSSTGRVIPTNSVYTFNVTGCRMQNPVSSIRQNILKIAKVKQWTKPHDFTSSKQQNHCHGNSYLSSIASVKSGWTSGTRWTMITLNITIYSKHAAY